MTVTDPYAALHPSEPPRYEDPSRPDPFAGFRPVGHAARSLPPRTRLHSDDLLRLAAVDPSDPVEHAVRPGDHVPGRRSQGARRASSPT